MRIAQLSAIAALVWITVQPAFGQPALGQLEQRLQGLVNPAPPADAGSANANGFLGAKLDEGEQGRGVRVESVQAGAPAEKGGLKAGDLITAIDGKRITNLDEYDANAKRPAGAKLAFTIEREGRSQPLTVTLGTRPAAPSSADPGLGDIPPVPPTFGQPGAAPSGTSPALIPPTGSGSPSTLPSPATPDAGTRPGIVAQPQEPRSLANESPPSASAPASAGGGASLGVTVAPQSEQGRGPGSRSRRGALVAGVKAGSPADLAGLREGFLIVQMDGRPINSDDDLVAAIRAARPNQEVELTYYEGDRLGRKAVRLAQAGASAAPSPGSGAFGGATPPGPSTAAPRLPGGRPPLINRVEQLVDNFSRSQGVAVPNLPTVPTNYDPSAMAALMKSVTELTEAVSRLEERVKAIEGKQPGSSSAPTPLTPGFGVPSTLPGPSFGPPTGAGTNP